MKYHPILFSGPMIRAVLRDVDPKTQTRRVIKLPPDAQDVKYWTTPSGRSQEGYTDPGVNYWTEHGNHIDPCPYGQPGDRLYVKEAAWIFCEKRPNGTTKTGRPKWHYAPFRMAPVFYVADGGGKPTIPVEHPETRNEWCWKYKTARFMPRWASRITLEITDIRAQRLQEISEDDAKAEGVELWNTNWPQDHWNYENAMRCKDYKNYLWHGHAKGPISDAWEWQYSNYKDAKGSFSSLWQSINTKRPGCSWDDNPFVWAVGFRRVQP